MSLSFGMLIIVVGGIIKRLDDNNVDSIFWLGALFTVFLLTIICNYSARSTTIPLQWERVG